MPADLSSYLVADDETSDIAKQNGLINTVEASLNALGDTTKNGWAAGEIFTLAQLKQTGATSGQAIIWNGTQWAPGAAGGTTYKKVTQKDVANTVTETDLLNGEITIGANVLSSTGAIRFTAAGDYLNNSGSDRTIRLKLKLGATTIWDSGVSAAITSGAGRRAWRIAGEIQALNSTSSQRGSGLFTLGSSNAATTGTGDIGLTTTANMYYGPFLAAASALNMTSAQTLVLTVIHSSAATTISMRLERAYIEVS